MEASAIKSPIRSPNTLDAILSEVNPRVKTITDLKPELANTTSVPVDHKNNISHLTANSDALEVLNRSRNQNPEGIVEGLKDSDNISSTSQTENKMTKTATGRVSGKKEITESSLDDKKTGKSTLVKNTNRKALVEKQICSIPTCDQDGIFLRSKRKKGIDVGRHSNENEVTETSKNGSQSIDEANCNSIKEKDLGENSDPMNIGNEKQETAKVRTRRSIPYEGLSLMEEIIIRGHEMLGSMSKKDQSPQAKDDRVSLSAGKSSTDGSTSSIKNDVPPKKKYHRRKCSEPLKNERVQTRQSRSITLIQKKSECTYSSQDAKHVKCVLPEPDKGAEEETPAEGCTMICTSDINLNNQESSPDKHQDPMIGSADKEKEQELRNKGLRVLNITKNSPTVKIHLGNENDFECTSINTNISVKKTTCSKAIIEHPELAGKRRPKAEDENPKRKLRHVTAEAMPVYTSSIAMTKNESKSKSMISVESVPLSQTRNNGDKSNDTNHGKDENKDSSPSAIEKKAQPFYNNMSLRSRTDKTTESKLTHLSHTDSEDTLSNVESIPNSPAQENWSKLARKNLKLCHKRMKPNSDQSNSHRDPSSVTNMIPNDVLLSASGDRNMELRSARKRKCSQTETSTSLNCSTNNHQTGLRYYVETSTNTDPHNSDGSDKDAENFAGNRDYGESQMPWLRHYERPHKTRENASKNSGELEESRKENSPPQNQGLYHQRKEVVGSTQRTGYASIPDKPLFDDLHSTEKYTIRNKRGTLPPPVKNLPRKPGRPRKTDTQKPQTNLKGNKRKGPPRSRTAMNGSGLTKSELERLFFKFLQDGHFRVVPGQPPIIIHSDDMYKNYSSRMQCYDPREYFLHPYDAEPKSNVESKTYPHLQHDFPTYNNNHRFYPSNNSNSGELGHGSSTINSNSQNFSNEFLGQTTYSRNLSPYSTQRDINSYSASDKPVINTSGFNTVAHTNPAPNYMQSGCGIVSDYQQNFHNNNQNLTENNSYSDSYSGIDSINSTGSMNDTKTGTGATNPLSTTNSFEDDFNFFLNTQEQYQNLTPGREIDLTISNGNTTISNNSVSSMQDTPPNNANLDWNLSGTNQHLNSANELFMNFNSINNTNELGQAIDGSSDLHQLMNNTNSMMNGPHPWINRSNNTVNSRLPVLPPWHSSSPMYYSYSNNGSAYYNNMFNPYPALTGFDLSNACMDFKNDMEMNNENPWMSNTLPGSGGYQSTSNSTDTGFSHMNSGSLQEKTLNQGMNLSLSSETVVPHRNCVKLDSTDVDMGNGNGLDSTIEQLKASTFEQIEADNKEEQQQSYGKETPSPYSSGYSNDMQKLDFNNAQMSNVDDNNVNNQQKQNPSQIQDYMNLRPNELESCLDQSYGQNGPRSCDINTDLPSHRQTEMSKLRQELADFTRQYSEDQMIPTPQVSVGDEIFI